MKGIKIRLSRKLALILGGIVLLGGGSGAAALYVGADRFFGPSYADMNGLSCTTVQTVKIKRDQRYWVRKYVVTDPGDGLARVRTAVRVAKAVQAAEKADLVQIALIDKAGPTDRAAMRGRAIGAQVIYTPDPSRVPEGAMNHPLAAFYLDGTADAAGQYFGMRVDLPFEDIESMAQTIQDASDCIEPVVATASGEHGAPSGHGAAPAGGHDSGGHEEGHDAVQDGGHGDGGEKGQGADGHGEPAAGTGHGTGEPAVPVAEGHVAPHGEAAQVVASTPEKKGFLASITGMFFGDKQDATGIDPNVTAASEKMPVPATSPQSGQKADAPAAPSSAAPKH